MATFLAPSDPNRIVFDSELLRKLQSLIQQLAKKQKRNKEVRMTFFSLSFFFFPLFFLKLNLAGQCAAGRATEAAASAYMGVYGHAGQSARPPAFTATVRTHAVGSGARGPGRALQLLQGRGILDAAARVWWRAGPQKHGAVRFALLFLC